MKLRFNSFDIVCGVTELQSLVGLRVNQVYDIDNKTYLIRLQGGGEAKKVLLLESGIRFHTTAYNWPKNVAPSGFSMKLRKHLKNKRLEKVQQLGVDRIVDFQFGIGDAAYHIILELYDKGNIILTDYEMKILYILRPHNDGEDVRFAVREMYPCERAKQDISLPSEIELVNAIKEAGHGDSLKTVIMPLVACGPTVIEHVLTKYNLITCIILQEKENEKEPKDDSELENKKGKKRRNKKNNIQLTCREFNMEHDLKVLMQALQEISKIMEEAKRNVSKGFIIQKKEEKPAGNGEEIEYFYQNIEYQPYNFCQYDGKPIAEFESFMLAVDEFYSSLESQKIDMKTLQQEREAYKKLLNVRKDHTKRIEDLNKIQENDKQKAELITMNQSLVDNAILAIRSAIANQMSWPHIHELVKAAQANADPVAGAIKELKLEINHISLKLSDPYDVASEGEDHCKTVTIVDVNLALSAWANARQYYDQKRSAAQKEQKTINASQKALKSAEKKTQQTLKDVRNISIISKARRVYWFEKFYWFISSENYLVIGGRDAQQNELIVKRYMRQNDIYVHAEIQGASSVVVRNPNESNVPPKTLLEAGTMAISYSAAWDAKVITNAYWVRSDQVSKTAPTGEYLGTGSFMIRGKKNFLPSCHLVMGLSLLFKLEDSFIEKHRGERKVHHFEEEDDEYQVKNELKALSLKNEINQDNVETEDDNPDSKNDNNSTEELNNEIDLEFPDTQIKIEHNTSLSMSQPVTANKNLSNDRLKKTESNAVGNQLALTSNQEETTIVPAAAPRKKQKSNSKKKKEENDLKFKKDQNQIVKKQVSFNTLGDIENKNNSQAVKRGQKGKLKKIKEKYKDQDDEERLLRMQILKSAGKTNEINTDTKEYEEFSTTKDKKINRPNQEEPIFNADVENADDVPTSADVDMIDSLTGQPYEEDELLFVIPVVAPYQAIQNYKFKVKLTPGTGKRGRAAKTALTIFSKDKMCSPREKDLLKSIRDEALARNIPGKSKLSAPQLQKLIK